MIHLPQPEYRIVRDNYRGFEVQIRRWWWPFWKQVGFTNTHYSIEEAEQFAADHARGYVAPAQDTGKYLGRFITDPRP